MDRDDAIALAQAHIEQAGIAADGWHASINGRLKRALGRCAYGSTPETRKIELSAAYVDAYDEATIEQTIIHEVAHAVAGYDAGHGPEWKAAAKMLGYVGEPTASNKAAHVPTRWLMMCGTCGEVLQRRHRRGRQNLSGWFHRGCDDSLNTLYWLDTQA